MTKDIDEELRITLRFPKDLSKYLREDFEFFKYQAWSDYFKDRIRILRDIEKVFPDIFVAPHDSSTYHLPCVYRVSKVKNREFQGFTCICKPKDSLINVHRIDILTPEICAKCQDIKLAKKFLDSKSESQRKKVVNNILIKNMEPDRDRLQSYEQLKTIFKKYKAKPLPKDFIDYISNIKKPKKIGKPDTLARLTMDEILKMLELAWISDYPLSRIAKTYGISKMTVRRILKNLEPFKEKMIEYFMSLRLNEGE